MDVLKAVETYITKMVSEPSVMKVLLLDSHTVRPTCFPATIIGIKRLADAHRVLCFYSVDFVVPSGLPYRPNR